MTGCVECSWKKLTLREKWRLIWGMRISWPRYSRWDKLLDNLSISEWKWRYNSAKITAELEDRLDLKNQTHMERY